MRKLHRTLGLVFAPFLATTAVTGLLWAYAPYLYLKAPAHGPAPMMDENRNYVPVDDAIRAAKALTGEGRVNAISLKAQSGRLVYVMSVESAKSPKEVWVDADTAKAEIIPQTTTKQFHAWVMKIHKLNFFGTKKELTAIPGMGLLLMLGTGLFLLKRGK